VYATWLPIWQTLLDVYEGAGGFLDGERPYLYAHPREWLDHSLKTTGDGSEAGTVKWSPNPNPRQPTLKLKTRRQLARYENVASTLLDQLKAALFRKGPLRSFAKPDSIPEDHPLRKFWDDADGTGRSIDAVMPEAWVAAATFGHMILLGDRQGETPENPTAADTLPVIARLYTPIDMIDWLTDDVGRLTSVRLLEAAPRTSFEETDAQGYQVRTVTPAGWRVEAVAKPKRGKADEATAAPQADEKHGFGALPVVVLYARRRALTPLIGRSVLGDPALYVDLYNLVSEVRELLRSQTFAILNVPIGDKQGGVQAEMEMIGSVHGTGNILFSTHPADFISPKDTNVNAYHEHIDRLVRTIYRLAVVAWESDSKDAETAESRQLKKEDLHQMLAGFAAECEVAERQLAELVYRGAYGDGWQKQWDADGPVINYPDSFDVTMLADKLEEAAAAFSLELGETATRQMKKRLVPELLPGLTQEEQKQIETEIDAVPVQSEQEKQAELLEMKFAAQGPPMGGPPQ
jgi:hypothetical protein